MRPMREIFNGVHLERSFLIHLRSVPKLFKNLFMLASDIDTKISEFIFNYLQWYVGVL